MSGINDVVSVQITRETIVPVGLSFGWVNFVSANAAFTPKVKIYGSMEEVDADGQAGADTKAFAALYFGQALRPTRLYVTKKGADSWTAALSAAETENSEWYGIAISSVLAADILAVAAWTESRTKIFLARGATDDIVDSEDTDDILSQLQDLGYERTIFFYHHDAATVPVEAAAIGSQMPKKPGSSQWAYKRFAGITPSPISVGERSAILGKNGNVYSDRANLSVFEPGRTVSGEWIDVVIGTDSLTQDIQTRVWNQFLNNEKIPYTNDGVNIIVNAIEAALAQGVRDGILAATPPPFVTAPLVEDVSPTDKGNRILPDVEFGATLAGGIVKTMIRGKLAI
jgi:hypothetical protein